MFRTTLQGGMQNADIEPAGDRVGVARKEIFHRRGRPETTPVQGHFQAVNLEGFCLFR